MSLNTTLQNLISSIQTVRLLVPVHQSAFYVGSPVQDSATDLGIWQYAVVAVVLETPAADFKYHCHFLVGIIAFSVQRGLAVVSYFSTFFERFSSDEKKDLTRMSFSGVSSRIFSLRERRPSRPPAYSTPCGLSSCKPAFRSPASSVGVSG